MRTEKGGKALGVNLTPIMIKKVLGLRDLKGRSLAVDANNYLYQFLSLIRTPDGTPLTDSHGNVTSHLAGLLYRSSRLIYEFNIELIFVFDGKPPALKEQEIKKRQAQRTKAFHEWQEALRTRDYPRAFSKAVTSSRLTSSMVEDAKTLLTLLGIPYVQAPSEGEAQAAFMAKEGDVWGASSKDYDSLLFGAPRLLRFLTIHGQEYLPSKGVGRPLEPELITLVQLLSHLKLTRAQLVDLAILVGTDFNQGAAGIGPKTALKLISQYGRIEKLPTALKQEIPPQYEAVRDIYLRPKTTTQYSVNYGRLEEDQLFDFLCNKRDFAPERVETAVQRMREVYKRKSQTGLENWLNSPKLRKNTEKRQKII
jgi:flap endonuclease-1